MTDHDCGDPFAKLVEDVKKFGWHVILVRADEEGPGFAYTVGVHKTHDQPEILIIGLRPEVMHPLLNECVERMKKGVRFRPGERYADLIEGYDCQFRPVHPSHYADYVGQAIDFYEGRPFPLLQCVWPDMQGRFPWDRDVNPRLGRQQPLLDTPWPFKEPRNLAVFTTRYVLDDGRPVVRVNHDVEGDWQFLCGSPVLETKDCKVVGLHEMFELDPSLGDLADLPVGWAAERAAPGAPWKRERCEEEPE